MILSPAVPETARDWKRRSPWGRFFSADRDFSAIVTDFSRYYAPGEIYRLPVAAPHP